MIDTIKLKLNNVSKYPLTLTKFESTTRTGQTLIHVDEDTGEYVENTKVRALLHHDSDTIIPLSKRSQLHVASSDYSVQYFYNITQDYIDFEFSVPKYMYGTNILQFIKYYSQDSDDIYEALNYFVSQFFVKNCPDVIDMLDVELLRLDLCYNQFFNSKYDAKKYLNEQKELLVKYARSTKNAFRTYENALLYTTKRYSFKIYHKGDEFRKNDRRKLAKSNPTGHSIEELQLISDKILRYEVTFRKAQIDYLFEQNNIHLDYVKFLRNEAARKSFRLTNRPFYDRCIEFTEQSKHFVFAKIEQHEAIMSQTVSFNKKVFNTMFTFFWDYVKKYQLSQKLSVYDILKKIDENNEIRDTATSKKLRADLSFNKPMLTVLALLTNYESLDSLRKSELMSKTTFYRYKKQLSKLGINSEARLIDIPPPALDYLDYKMYFGHHHLK